MTTNQKNLNKFQRANLSRLTPMRLAVLKTGDWRITPASLMECVECGGSVTTPNLAFVNFDATAVKCYSCQRKHKKPMEGIKG